MNVPPEVGFIADITIATITIICDTPLILLIFVNQHLRCQKELIIIAFMCVADTVHSIACLLSAIYRLWIAVNDLGLPEKSICLVLFKHLGSVTITNYDCMRYGFIVLFMFSYQLMGTATLFVAVERLIAVMKPVYYRSLSPRFSFGVMGGLFIYITTTISFFLVIIYSNPPFLTSAYCFSEAFTPGIWKYMLYFRLSTLVISSLLYTPISARIYKMSKTLKGGISNINKGNYSKRLIRTTMTIGLTVTAELILVVIPDIMINFNPFGLGRYQLIWFICAGSKGVVNVLLVSLRHDEIKRKLRGIPKIVVNVSKSFF